MIQAELKLLLKKSLQKAYPELEVNEIQLERTRDQKFGDFACNLAMQLKEQLKINPRIIAGNLVCNLPPNTIIEKTDIAGPGFVNFFIKKEALTDTLEQIYKMKDHFGNSKTGKHKTLVIDYGAENIAKSPTIGHLRSNIIGQALYNLYRTLDFQVIGDNHLGDFGTQFGKLIYAYKNWGDQEKIKQDPINELVKLYVDFHQKAEQNPELDDFARAEFKKLEQGDRENKKIWRWIYKESLKEFDYYHKLLNIKFDYYLGESFYLKMLPQIIELFLTKKIATQNPDGSIVVHFPAEKYPPFLIQKSDGATLYSTRDLATIMYRLNTFKPDLIVYVVAEPQRLHFNQLFECARLIGWDQCVYQHAWFGMINLENEQMSTRKGNVIYLKEVIDEAIKKARKVLEDKRPDLPAAEKASLAQIIGIGALKFNDLSQNKITPITFNWDKMLSFDGDSAPYLQYTYARSQSILRKAKIKHLLGGAKLTEEAELELVKELVLFPEIIEMAAQEFKPNILATYLLEVAAKFNAFYAQVPVLQAESAQIKNLRMKLIATTATVLKKGLLILGIEVPERM